MNQSNLRFSFDTSALLIYFMLANIANGLYIGLGIQSSPVFQFVSIMAFVWALGWWIVEDNKRYGLAWVQSYWVILYVIGWLIIPIYLFRTRRSKAILPLLLFVGVSVAFFVLGIVIAVVINIVRSRLKNGYGGR